MFGHWCRRYLSSVEGGFGVTKVKNRDQGPFRRMVDSAGPKRHHTGPARPVGRSFQLGKKLADRRGNFVAMSLERKVAGIKEAYLCFWQVTFERFSASRQKERSFLPHTAGKGGMCLRK
jgi:hypothetical protein